MKLIKEPFRCDLCGRYSERGVTEQEEDDGEVKRTCVCAACVARADKILFPHAPPSRD